MSESGSEDELEVRYGSGRIECMIKNSCKTIVINETRNIQRHDPDFDQRIHCILCGIPSVASDSLKFSSIFDSKGSFSSVAMILHTVSGVKITESNNPNENMMCQKCRGQIIALYSARKWLEELQKWLVNHLVSTVNKKRCAKVQVPESYKSIDFFAQQQQESFDSKDPTDSKFDGGGDVGKVSNSNIDKKAIQSYLTVDVKKNSTYVEKESCVKGKPKCTSTKKKAMKNCSCSPVALVYINGSHGMTVPVSPALNVKPGTKTARPILPKLPRGTKVSAEVQTDNVRFLKKRRRSKNEDDCSAQSIEESKLTTATFTDITKGSLGEDGLVPSVPSKPVQSESTFGELEQQQLGASLNTKIVETDMGPTVTSGSQKQQDYDEITSAISSWFGAPTTVCQDNTILPQYTENRPVVLQQLDNCSAEPYQTVAVEPSFPGYTTGSFCVTGPASVLPSNTIFQQSTDSPQFSQTQLVQGQQCIVTSSIVTSSTSGSDAIISVSSQGECPQPKDSTFPSTESLYPQSQHSFASIAPPTGKESNEISLDNGISMLAEVSYKHYTSIETDKTPEVKKDKSINTINYDLQQSSQTESAKEDTSSMPGTKMYEEAANSKMFIRIPGNCKLCNHVFNTGDGHIARKIQDHMFEHSSLNHNYSNGSMQYSCKGCDNKFPSLDTLKKHYRSKHMIGERFQCLVCNMAYMTFNALSDHLNCHKGLKPYKCGMCGAEYAARTSLRTHLTYSHKERAAVTCKSCRAPSNSKQQSDKLPYYCRKCKKKNKT